MSFQSLVYVLSQIKKKSLPDYAHVKKVSKYEKKITINVIQHDDIYDRFTMEHFPLRQSMSFFFLLATVLYVSCFCYFLNNFGKFKIWTLLQEEIFFNYGFFKIHTRDFYIHNLNQNLPNHHLFLI
jgi:hypothetical protein